MKTAMDAVKYYVGSSFVCGKHEEHHTHIVNAKGTDRFYSAYLSDVCSDFVVCTIGEFNSLVEFLADKQSYSDCKSEWEYVQEFKLKSKPPTFTKEMDDNGVVKQKQDSRISEGFAPWFEKLDG